MIKYGALFKLLLRMRRVEAGLQSAWVTMRAADAASVRTQQALQRGQYRGGASGAAKRAGALKSCPWMAGGTCLNTRE